MPDVRADDPDATFPGMLGGAWDAAASPRIHRLSGIAVLPVCDWQAAGLVAPEEFPPSYVDMAGPGQDRSPWGATSNVVLRCVPARGVPVAEADAAIRRAALGLARALAATTLDAPPDDVRRVGGPGDADPDLPAVCAIVQVASEGPLVDTFFDGGDLRDLMPRVIDHRWLAAGRLTNGAYDWPGVRNTTANYQDLALVRTLAGAHGRTLRFAGTILAPGTSTPPNRNGRGRRPRRRSPPAPGDRRDLHDVLVGQLPHRHDADGPALRRGDRGDRARLRDERRLDRPRRRGLLVSTGNEDELVSAWTPDRIGAPARGARGGAGAAVGLRGRGLPDGEPLSDGGAGLMTVVHYLNQFFAGLGGEEAADHEPARFEGPQGPGKALEAAGLHVDLTVACGDDRFALHENDCLATLLSWIDEADADVVVCGPSFGSGRYGYACGVLARELGRRGTRVVAAMTSDSPGVLASEGAAYIVPTTANVAGMRDAVPVVASLASRLAAGAPVGTPDEEGYLPRGLRVNVLRRARRRAPWGCCWPSSAARCAPRSSR